MSETKWTPGPWKLVKTDDEFAPFEIRMGTAIKSPHNCRSIHLLEIGWCLERGDAGYAEGKANLRLIAAAPALYEALEALRIAVVTGNEQGGMGLDPCSRPGCSVICEAFTKACAALAAARGESPDRGQP